MSGIKKFTESLHPRNFIGEFAPSVSADKRTKKLRKSKAQLVKAQNDFVATASVRTRGGGRRALTTKEANRFLNDTNVQVNSVQGRTAGRRGAAVKLQKAKASHLANFGRKPAALPKTRNAGHKIKGRR